MKRTVGSIKRDHNARIEEIKKSLVEEDVWWSKVVEKAEEFGGFVDRSEIRSYLGISNARASILLTRGEFRNSEYGYSFDDVKRYKRRRKPGRPRKSKTYKAEQFELPLD